MSYILPASRRSRSLVPCCSPDLRLKVQAAHGGRAISVGGDFRGPLQNREINFCLCLINIGGSRLLADWLAFRPPLLVGGPVRIFPLRFPQLKLKQKPRNVLLLLWLLDRSLIVARLFIFILSAGPRRFFSFFFRFFRV